MTLSNELLERIGRAAKAWEGESDHVYGGPSLTKFAAHLVEAGILVPAPPKSLKEALEELCPGVRKRNRPAWASPKMTQDEDDDIQYLDRRILNRGCDLCRGHDDTDFRHPHLAEQLPNYIIEQGRTCKDERKQAPQVPPHPTDGAHAERDTARGGDVGPRHSNHGQKSAMTAEQSVARPLQDFQPVSNQPDSVGPPKQERPRCACVTSRWPKCPSGIAPAYCDPNCQKGCNGTGWADYKERGAERRKWQDITRFRPDGQHRRDGDDRRRKP